MATKLGSTTISKLYLGATEVTKAYLGSTEVYNTGTPATNDAFELTVETTAANESFLLPMLNVTSIDIDWGDGTVDTGITSDSPMHTYATAGTHSISVTGSATSVQFFGSGSQGKLRTVTNLGALGWTSFRRAFYTCSNMTSFVCGDTDTSNVTTMSQMFHSCTSATVIDVSGFDTSSAADLNQMFRSCVLVTNIDVSGFNTSNVTNMGRMFEGCLLVTSLDVAGFDTSSVTNISIFSGGMFENCPLLENLDIDGWDVTSVTDGVNFLNNSNNALTTAQYDATLIAWAAQNLQQNVVIHFGDAVPTNAGRLARNAIVRDYGWTITDGDGAHDTNDMFDLTVETTAANESFLLPLTGVTNVAIDWGDGTIDTNITADSPTHTYATAGTHSISVTGSATSVVFSDTPSGAKLRTVTNLGALGWTNFAGAFRNCSSMTSFECGDTDTSSVTNMQAMFFGCSSAATIDVSGFDTSSVTSFGFSNQGMFRFCSSVTTLDVSGFDTSNASTFNFMFNVCSSLENLDIDGWDVTSLTQANYFLVDANLALTTAQYDAVLIAWAAQNLQQGVTIHFGDAVPSNTGRLARNAIIRDYGWSITDGDGVHTTNDMFELTVETTAAAESFLLPMLGVTEIAVDWGDGTIETGITVDNPTHTYATAGTHEISVTGSATRVQFDGSGSESKLRTVTNLGALGWTNLNSAFLNCSSMTSFVCGDTDTSSVTEMRSMFQQCSSATTIDVSGFDTSSVLAMTSLFQNCGSLTTLDVSGFDTSSLTDARQIFLGCSSLTSIDVSGWNTSNFERVNFLFGICGSLENLDIDGWDVTSIIAADNFLLGSNLALTTAQYDQVLINWAAQNLQQNISIHFGDAVPSNTGRLARNAIIRDYGWSITDGDGLHTTNDMFELTVETTAANESFLLPMLGVTEIAVDWGDGTIETGITADNPTHTYATAGTHSISVTGSATGLQFGGSGSQGKVRTVTNFGSLGWTNLTQAFYACTNMTSFVCGDTDTSNVTTFENTFRNCNSITTLDVSGFNTSNASDFIGMFRFNPLITTIDVSGFNMSNATRIAFMFQGCSSLANLDIDGWDVTSLTNGNSFLDSANNALTTAQYDATLIAWAAQAVQSNVTIHFGDAQYTAGGAAETARNTLVSTYGWTITDGGPIAQVTLTIPAANTASLTDFPIYVDLSDMPATFWSTVTNGGGDIRVYESDGTTELPREVVSCDVGGLRLDGVDEHVALMNFTTAIGDEMYIELSNPNPTGVRHFVTDRLGGNQRFFAYASNNRQLAYYTGMSLEVDGVAYASGEYILENNKTHRLKFTINEAATTGFRLGTNFAASGDFLEATYHRFKITRGGTVIHDFNFDAQSSGTTITDTVGGKVGTLNGFDAGTDAHWNNGRGELHFKGDLSALSDTDFIITADGTSSDYAVTDTYGRNAVWSDYELVFHGEDATTNSAGTALTETGSVSIGTGKIGSAGAFNVSDYSSLSTSNYSGTATLQAWGNRGTSQQPRFLSIGNISSTNGQLNICVQPDGLLTFQIWKPDGTVDLVQGSSSSPNTFYMLHGVKNGDASHLLYEDGALANSNTLTAVFNTIDNIRIGASADSTPFSTFNNTDEARIRFTALSADWIATEYANQSSPSTFYTIT